MLGVVSTAQAKSYIFSENLLTNQQAIDPENPEPENPETEINPGSFQIGGLWMNNMGQGKFEYVSTPDLNKSGSWEFQTSSRKEGVKEINLTGAKWKYLANTGTGSFINDTSTDIKTSRPTFIALAGANATANIRNEGGGTFEIWAYNLASGYGSTVNIINSSGYLNLRLGAERVNPLNALPNQVNITNQSDMYISTVSPLMAEDKFNINNTGSLYLNYGRSLIWGGELYLTSSGSDAKLIFINDYPTDIAEGPDVYVELNTEGQLGALEKNGQFPSYPDQDGPIIASGFFNAGATDGATFKLKTNLKHPLPNALFNVLATGNGSKGAIKNSGNLYVTAGEVVDNTQQTFISVLSIDGAKAEITNSGEMSLEGSNLINELPPQEINKSTPIRGTVIYSMAEGFNDSKAVIRNQEKGNLTLTTGIKGHSDDTSHVIKYMVRAENPSTIGAVGPYAAIKNEGRGKLLIGAYGGGGGDFNTAIKSMIKLTANNDATPMKAKAEIINEGGGELVIEGNIVGSINFGGSFAIENMISIDNCTTEACKKANHEIVALVKNTNGTMRLNAGAIGSYKNIDINGAQAIVDNQDLMFLEYGSLSPETNINFINRSGATLKAKANALFFRSGTLLPESEIKNNLDFSSSNSRKIITEKKAITILNDNGKTLSTTVDGYEVSYDDFGVTNEFISVGVGQQDFDGVERTFEDGGFVVITDIAEGTLAAKKMRTEFEKQFGTGTKLTFAGDMATTDFIRPMLDTLISRGDVVNGSVLSDVNFSAQGNELLVGANGINQDIGFMGITNATGIKVTDGEKINFNRRCH